MTPILDLLATLFWLIVVIVLLRLWRRSDVSRYYRTTSVYPSTPSSPAPLLSAREIEPQPPTSPAPTATSTQPRILIAYADNPADHPYDETPLTALVDHLNDKHWEVLNMVAESGSPSRWRKEHAADHGLVIR